MRGRLRRAVLSKGTLLQLYVFPETCPQQLPLSGQCASMTLQLLGQARSARSVVGPFPLCIPPNSKPKNKTTNAFNTKIIYEPTRMYTIHHLSLVAPHFAWHSCFGLWPSLWPLALALGTLTFSVPKCFLFIGRKDHSPRFHQMTPRSVLEISKSYL